MATIWKVLTRKKVIDPVSAEETRLSRVLNTFDLTALGVGSTLGVGVYVLAGHVAKDTAGPAVVLSFLIAAIASVFAGLCYAEFGARTPRAGSAYIYSYVCVGEFIAFVIGWNLILEYVIGSASVARGLSLYLDTLINNTMQHTFMEIAPINIPYLSQYFDFFACGLSIVLSVALAFGMKESALANNIFTVVNIGVVLFVVIAGSLKADPANWNVNPANVSNSTYIGDGGFFPFGIEGMIKGAATCFYGFVGFDCIATTGEEVKNPKKAIPISIILSLFIIFLAYFGTSTVVTLMVPYYLQNRDAPIPYAFEHIGWNTAKWIVSIGGIFGLCASLFGAMFPLPRIIYAMATDNLVFKFLGSVNSRFQTPVVGTLLAGLLTGLMAAMFELKQLVNMMSIGTLLAYTIVAASVLLLRYTDNNIGIDANEDQTNSEEQDLISYENNGRYTVVGQIFNLQRYKNPTKTSEAIVTIEVFIYCIMCIFIGLSAIYLRQPISNGEIWAIVLTTIVVIVAVVVIMSLVTQPTSNKELTFKVPMVPLIPALSILINIYLMLMLDSHTWIRFAVWMAIGIPTYYFSVRPYREAQNKNISSKSSIDYTISMVNGTQNNKFNGHTNIAFINDDDVIKKDTDTHKSTKKQQAPLPPHNGAFDENSEIPVEIAKLDAMLEEVSNNINSNLIDRKLSVGTLSNVSENVSHEENVIVVVHRDNVCVPAEPISPTPSICIQSPNDAELQVDKSDDQKSKMDNCEIYENSPTVEGTTTIKKEPLEVLEFKNTSAPPEISRNITSETENAYIENSSVNLSDLSLPTDAPSFQASPTPTPPPSPMPSPIPEEKLGCERSTPEPSSTVSVSEEKLGSSEPSTPLAPPLPDSLLSDNLNHFTIPRPTSANLTSVVLKPVKQRKKSQSDEKERFEPDEGNLKAGSEKYKSFVETLNGKLQKSNIVPSYIPYIKKNITPKNSPIGNRKNENVIEESINKRQAKEKLNMYINNRLSALEKFIEDNESAKNVDTSKEKIESENVTNNMFIDIQMIDDDTDVKDDISKNDFTDHKSRMQNVFRSIHLKKVNSLKELMPEPKRNANSLGSSFILNDKSKHREAMSEIFETIKLRRKDSRNQSDSIN